MIYPFTNQIIILWLKITPLTYYTQGDKLSVTVSIPGSGINGLEFSSLVNETTGELEKTSTAIFRELIFIKKANRYIRLIGSLHKYYNKALFTCAAYFKLF